MRIGNEKSKLESKFGNVSLILISTTSTYIDSLSYTTVIVNYLIGKYSPITYLCIFLLSVSKSPHIVSPFQDIIYFMISNLGLRADKIKIKYYIL